MVITTRSEIGTLGPWLGLVVVLLLLTLGAMSVIDQQRKHLLIEAHRRAEDDINLIHALVQDALQGRNYQLIDGLLKQWGKKRHDIEELVLTAANGFKLGGYQRSKPAVERYQLTRQVPYSYRGQASLVLVKDLRAMGISLARLQTQLFSGVVGVGILLGLLIWLGLRRRAEAKILRARTRALHETNEALQNEISERRCAQRELARHRERLEDLVTERTAKLQAAQQELIRKERLATLGQLTATVSHELRNPLGTLRTSIYHLGTKVRGKGLGVEPTIERAERNIRRCDDIITELLDYTRIQDLKLELTVLDGWLAEVISDAVIPAQITLCKNLQAPVKVDLDRSRLRRGVLNVLDNACQALAEIAVDDARERLIKVKTSVLPNRVEIQFDDQGPGIPAEVKAHLFEPLYTTKGFGVGLGLCIVKQIMEQHCGGVKISSEPGSGTCVRLWLPRPN